jgi:predicted dinucleotide-utilizing enzyme
MKYGKFVLLIFLMSSLYGCDYYDDRLVVNNRNTSNIYVAISQDTVIRVNDFNAIVMPDYFVKSNEKKNIVEPGSQKAWEAFAEKSLNQQLHIFIFSEDTLNKYLVSTVVNKKLFNRRIDLSVNELKVQNWVVVYE